MEDDPTRRCLEGLRVVEFGDGIAGSVAASTLAILGADVTKVVGPQRPVERVGPMVDLHTNGNRFSALAASLDGHKRIVDLLAADDFLAIADIVIDDQCGLLPASLPALMRDMPVITTITPFGLSGPDSGRPGGERTLQAAGGLLSTVSSVSTGQPIPAPGFVALRSTGHVAALATLHGLDRYRSGGSPVQVDVSAQESVVFTCALPECAHVLFRCPGQAGSGRYLAPSGVFTCKDGWVRIAAIEDHQWRGLVSCLGSPPWTQGLDGRQARIEHARLITQRVEEWTKTQFKDICSQSLQVAGVPATPVNGPSELLASPQFDHRGVFTDDNVRDARVRRVGPPWRSRVGGLRDSRVTGIAGLRVLELTHVLAGPIIGELLGAMGAKVVRLEDLDRLDIYRRSGPFFDGIAGTERGAYFAVANHSKDSVAVSGVDVSAAAHQILESVDVLVENVGASRLRRLHIDPDMIADALGVLTARVSGFGSDGPLAGYRVYANNVQAYGGLALATTDRDGTPARLGSVLADPLSSVITATVVAAWSLGPLGGRGGSIDLSMAEVVMGLIAEQVIAVSAAGESGSLSDTGGLRGVYRCRDGKWIALDVRSVGELASLLSALDPSRPPETGIDWPTSNSFWSRLDAEVSDLVGATDQFQALEQLFAHGVPASGVLNGSQLVDNTHLRDRGFFPSVTHQDPNVGSIRLIGVPWRFVGEGPLPITPPPVLGNATNAYLSSKGVVT